MLEIAPDLVFLACMLKWLKYLFFVIAGILLIGFALLIVASDPLPEGSIGKQADDLALKMKVSINDSAWNSTGALSWGYRGTQLIWDKKRHLAEVKFDGNCVRIDIDRRRGIIIESDPDLTPDQKIELCHQAWKHWANDSFWLNPISKVFDAGTQRRLATLDDRTEALLITYTSGGATPGDSYLWILDDHGRPKAWRFWVSIIPLKGMYFTWEGWVSLGTGVQIATVHKGLVDITVSNPVGKSDLLQLTDGMDIFSRLLDPEKNAIEF